MSSKLVLVSILSIFILSSCMEKKKPIIIGHRGAMGHETENTLASIKSAMALKVDMIEIDVFKLKNGEVVVFHDDTVDRLTDAKGHIEDFSFEELRKLVVEGGHTIPTLEEVLDVMDAEVDLNIELKGANTAERVNEIVESYISGANSFQEEVVEQLTAAEESIEEPTAEVEETSETSDETTTKESTAEVEETSETSDETTTEESTAEAEETSDETKTEKPEE